MVLRSALEKVFTRGAFGTSNPNNDNGVKMLASDPAILFNVDMDTTTPRTSPALAQPAARGLADPSRAPGLPQIADAVDWQAAGLVDQMLAYSDWWNLPSKARGSRARNQATVADRRSRESSRRPQRP